MFQKFLFVMLILFPTQLFAADTAVVSRAVGFIMGGSDGWSGLASRYSTAKAKVIDCKVELTVYVGLTKSVKAEFEFDFNKVNYNDSYWGLPLTFFAADKERWITLVGKQGWAKYKVSYTGSETWEKKNEQYALYLYVGFLKVDNKRNYAAMRTRVSRDRIAKAINDLSAQCPNGTSHY